MRIDCYLIVSLRCINIYIYIDIDIVKEVYYTVGSEESVHTKRKDGRDES